MYRFAWAILAFFTTVFAHGQIPPYYSSITLPDSGNTLKQQLSTLIATTHTTNLSYTPGIWDLLELADRNPDDTTEVLLIYGYNDTDTDTKNDRTRAISLRQTGSSSVGFWNREHVFAKSLGTPDLGTSGPGADGHHLRAADGQMNSTRNNRLFTTGSGNATTVGANNFYPGDEWKGDVARMMMYMHLRYPTQSPANQVGDGPITYSGIDLMPDLFLIWNYEDPVSDFERQRNEAIANAQGNRNPFIDNPNLAYRIWGGPIPTNTWSGVGLYEPVAPAFKVYPNPSGQDRLKVESTFMATTAQLLSAEGKLVLEHQPDGLNFTLNVASLPSGTYYLKLSNGRRNEFQRVVIKR